MAMLVGKVVFITGASSGIGRAAAVAFAREGSRLALAARRLDRLEDLNRELAQTEADVFIQHLDVRDVDAAASVVEDVQAHFGQIDVLVNNAGLARGLRPVEKGEETDWREMMETNVMGLLWVTRAAIPIMRRQGTGHIINLGSVAGHESYPGGSVYAASKHAVRAITQTLRQELLGSNIRVSSVDPGLVETEFSLVRFSGDAERARSVYKGLRPLGPDDIAGCIVFVASRPPHVNVDEIIVKPTAQATSTMVHREN